MFSLDRFYNIVHDNLVSKIHNGKSIYFYPFGTYNNDMILENNRGKMRRDWRTDRPFFHCYFFDQEPYYDTTFPIIKDSLLYPDHVYPSTRINILANSEKSDVKKQFIRSENYYDWYYFYHGFAALDWYRDFQYLNSTSFNRFDKVFICYNHLISKYRSYRLHLVSNLISQDLVKHGVVSLFLEDKDGSWKDTIQSKETPLDSRARIKIYNTLKNVTNPLIIDTDAPDGSMSAKVDISQLTSALWHIVTETVYFLPKLHLTEKIFKPIVAKRPFILAGAIGNLAYLKSYGFRTFDQWIDESYDSEEDHYVRIEKISAEIARLCAMPKEQLIQMHSEMQEVLEYNFDHFYNKFKITIVNELVDNFGGVLAQINNGRQPDNHSQYHTRFELAPEYLEEVKKRLSK